MNLTSLIIVSWVYRPDGLGMPTRHGGEVHTVRADHSVGLIAEAVLLAALSSWAGLGMLGWVVGLGCALGLSWLVNRGLAVYDRPGLGPADCVTGVRALLVCGVTALVVDSFVRSVSVTAIVLLATLALCLDAVDGRVARRTGTISAFGARFDMEVDAFLIFVLSAYVAPDFAVWVLAIGLARYALWAAGRLVPWLREPVPPRFWRKVVAAVQGVVLTVAASTLFPHPLVEGVLVMALVVLGESFGRDVCWLGQHRTREPSTDPRKTLVPVGHG